MHMPPPPPPPLHHEFDALSLALKQAIITTAQIFNFYADARRLGVANHVQHPPRALTAALGRELEKYDQLCDAIDTQLVRAIAVLQRDLLREEQRKEEEELKAKLQLSKLPPPDPMAEDPSAMSSEADATSARGSPVVPIGRRPSTISISSLHRPQFPLKLDLSSSSLRITEEEAAVFQKGLASPVTLAPKSARPVGPHEYPHELMAAFAANAPVPDIVAGPSAIDLALTDVHSNDIALAVGLGDSSDKPIELDLDNMDIEMSSMSDLFGDGSGPDGGDPTGSHDGLFSPVLPQGSEVSDPTQKGLSDFTVDTNELFGDFTSDHHLTQETEAKPDLSSTTFSSSSKTAAPTSLQDDQNYSMSTGYNDSTFFTGMDDFMSIDGQKKGDMNMNIKTEDT